VDILAGTQIRSSVFGPGRVPALRVRIATPGIPTSIRKGTTMKTVIACLVTGLVVAGGAGAYTAVVTPQQFAALKSQVAALKSETA
jgi:hypothetical protein